MSNEQGKFTQNPFHDMEEGEHGELVQGDRALWRAVITQALMDAGSESKKPEMKYEKAQAIAWLSGKSRDFYTVCGLAELEPEYVRTKAQEAIRNGCKWRLEPGQGPKRTKTTTANNVVAFTRA